MRNKFQIVVIAVLCGLFISLLAVNYRGAISMVVASVLMLAALGIQKRVFASRDLEKLFDIAATIAWVAVLAFVAHAIVTKNWFGPSLPTQPTVTSVTWTDADLSGVNSIGWDRLLDLVPDPRRIFGQRPGWKYVGMHTSGGTIWTVIDPRAERDDSVSYVLAGYVGTIKPVEALERFTLTEQFIVERQHNLVAECKGPCNISKTDTLIATTNSRILHSSAAGFALRELRIGPRLENNGTFILPLSKGTYTVVSLPTNRAIPTRAEVEEFPTRSFFRAKDVPPDSVKTYVYIHTEKNLWSPVNLRNGTVFSFIPPPFNTVRKAIHPLLGASTWSQWMIGLVTLATLLLVFVLKIPAAVWAFLRRFRRTKPEPESPGFQEYINLE